MSQQVRDRLAEPRVRLRLALCKLRFQPTMQLLHHRAAVLLMKLQPLLRCQRLRTRLGILAVDLAEHLQHIAAFVGKVRRYFHELSSSMGRQLASRISTPAANFGTFRDSASHIWIGAGSSTARRFSTSAMFSPACLPPVKKSAI